MLFRSGKSRLMRRVADELEQAGYTAQRVLCSSDPDSLDGVIFPQIRGTSILPDWHLWKIRYICRLVFPVFSQKVNLGKGDKERRIHIGNDLQWLHEKDKSLHDCT